MEMKLLPFTVESIEPNLVSNYGVEQIQAPALWAMDEKGAGVVVAIIDTGIETAHPYFQGSIIENKNFTSENSDQDLNGHGTHVAGIVKSVAPEVKFLICKVLNKEGSGDYSDIIRGIEYATNWRGPAGEKVRVLNMSLGGPINPPALHQAILSAVSKGILVVVASGNEGDNDQSTYEYSYPSNIQECITVAACDENRKLAYFSNNHKYVDIIAAGVKVFSSYLNGSYARLSGTSMATPHITGAIALLIPPFERQFKRVLTESEIFSLLVKSCCVLGYEKSSEGNGLPQLGTVFKKCEDEING
jgi:major intracellular serine protease